ncbi:MAG: 2-isopropylmalate synthase [Gammaproteobacteria bacterium]
MTTTATPERLVIFDTTLRDGEQAPGCSMSLDEKLRVANSLARMGVDVIEAGFPAASPGDYEAVKQIAKTVKGATICGLARSHAPDIERAWDALQYAEKARIHVFLATSAIHREYKLNMAKDEILRRVREGVTLARSLCDDVEFSPEDASRTEHDFLAEVVKVAAEAGATTINIPDTVGYTVPSEFFDLFSYLREQIADRDDIVLSVHCHDDLGMAVANSLAAVRGGARQIECTINGIGERAGNCSLEEVVMAVKTRPDIYPLETGIDSTRLYPTSRLVSKTTGMHVPRNKAIVGENAFAHEAGIHQHGMLQNAQTYEIMKPQDVGISRSNLVLGKHSGRHAFRQRVEELSFRITDEELERAFKDFKVLADKKKEIFDADIEALVLRRNVSQSGPWSLTTLSTSSSSREESQAQVLLTHENGSEVRAKGAGDGPVAAAFSAVEKALGIEVVLRNFDIRNVTTGEDAQGDVSVSVEYDYQEYHGSGLHTDIIEASVRALLQALNRVPSVASEKPIPATV